MKPTTKRKIRKMFSPIRRVSLNNKDFSIISMDCWGGIIYDMFGLEYKSPTIGLLLTGKDFVKFCCNLDYYLSLEIIPDHDINKIIKNTIKNGKSDSCPRWVGHVGDLTIKFIHYKSEAEAVEKWNRRRKRVNLKRVLLHFDDKSNHYIDSEDIEKLAQLPYPKIFTTTNKEYVKKYNFAYFVKGPSMKDVFRAVPLKKVKQIINEYIS